MDTIVAIYHETFSKHPGSNSLDYHELREYFIWAYNNNCLFWEEENDTLKAFGIAKPTHYGYDWWDYDPYGVSLHIFLYVQLSDDPQTKWRLLKQVFERFPHCKEAVWTHNKINEKRQNVCFEPFAIDINAIKRQLKRHLKE